MRESPIHWDRLRNMIRGETKSIALLKYCLKVIFEDVHLGFISPIKGNHFLQTIHQNIEYCEVRTLGFNEIS